MYEYVHVSSPKCRINNIKENRTSENMTKLKYFGTKLTKKVKGKAIPVTGREGP
jgi:hypothetical protein